MPDPHAQASDQSGVPAPAGTGPGSSHGRRWRPAHLIFEPPAAEPESQRFFDLESIEDPSELLRRSTELALAFQAAAERAADFQAIAAAQLADPKRFDALTPAEIGERVDWGPEYAAKIVEYGRSLLSRPKDDHH